VRKAPAKLDIAKAVAPSEQRFPMKKASTGYAAGYLTATQQFKSILTNKRSFGEALDELNRIEAEVRGKLVEGIDAEIKRVKRDGYNVLTENTPEGPFIVLRKIEVPADVQKKLDAAAKKVAPAADVKPTAKAPADAPKRRGLPAKEVVAPEANPAVPAAVAAAAPAKLARRKAAK
jgi:hypothetical protein